MDTSQDKGDTSLALELSEIPVLAEDAPLNAAEAQSEDVSLWLMLLPRGLLEDGKLVGKYVEVGEGDAGGSKRNLGSRYVALDKGAGVTVKVGFVGEDGKLQMGNLERELQVIYQTELVDCRSFRRKTYPKEENGLGLKYRVIGGGVKRERRDRNELDYSFQDDVRGFRDKEMRQNREDGGEMETKNMIGENGLGEIHREQNGGSQGGSGENKAESEVISGAKENAQVGQKRGLVEKEERKRKRRRKKEERRRRKAKEKIEGEEDVAEEKEKRKERKRKREKKRERRKMKEKKREGVERLKEDNADDGGSVSQTGVFLPMNY